MNNMENISQENVTDLADVTMLSTLKNPSSSFFCTIKDDGTLETKAKIYNALNKKCESLSEHLNETIRIYDVACHPVRLVDEKTGEITDTLRTVLIGEKECYEAVSQGVINSLQKIFAIIGSPTWEEGLELKAVSVTTRQKFKVTVLELVV